MPMPPMGPVPGWGGQLPWNQATPAPAMGPGAMPPQQPGAGPPTAMPPPPMGQPTGMPAQPQDGGKQTPLMGLPQLPGAPAGAPTGALGAPANQPGSPPQMARGGRVPQIAHATHNVRVMPRSEPTFGHVLQAAGLRKYDNGGAVRPVMLRSKSRQEYAQGGLVQAAGKVQDAGRFGDSMVVHLNQQEYQDLQARHGTPHINPETGLPEFFSLGKILSFVLPIAAMAIPGIGPAIGAALGLEGATAGIVGSALLGAGVSAGSSALNGKDPLKGALIGGVTGGLGSALSPLTAEDGALGSVFGQKGAGALLNAGLGAGTAAATGGNPLTGALINGGLSYFAPDITSKIKSGFGMAPNPGAPPDPLGEMVAKATPEAQTAGSTAGIAANTLPDGTLATDTLSPPSAPSGPSAPTAPGNPAPAAGSSMMSQVLPALMLASLAGGLNGSKGPSVTTTPPPASNVPAYFNQQFTPKTFAPQINMAAIQAMLANPGQYASQGGPGYYVPGTSGIGYAKGGALQMAAGHLPDPSLSARAGVIRGAGDGQSDDIDAKLADNEHVFDALTVAAAGRGSSEAGHKRLEKLKTDIRRSAGMKNPTKAPMMKTGALATAFKKASK